MLRYTLILLLATISICSTTTAQYASWPQDSSGQDRYIPAAPPPGYPDAPISCNAQYIHPLDITTAQLRQTPRFRYLQPAGWDVVELPNLCLLLAPDKEMAFGVIAPGNLTGNLSPERYMLQTLSDLGTFEQTQVHNATPVQPPLGFDQAGTYVISYRVDGQEFHCVINAMVGHRNEATYGVLQLVLGTPEQLQTNGRTLTDLCQSVVPMDRTSQKDGTGVPRRNPLAR
jgi:hypothetical protein